MLTKVLFFQRIMPRKKVVPLIDIDDITKNSESLKVSKFFYY